MMNFKQCHHLPNSAVLDEKVAVVDDLFFSTIEISDDVFCLLSLIKLDTFGVLCATYDIGLFTSLQFPSLPTISGEHLLIVTLVNRISIESQ